jgi:transposase-like protein
MSNNAATNYNIRNEIRLSNESIGDLSCKYNISGKTVVKWRGRNFVEDKSSRPDNINYKLSYLEKEIAISIRKLTWFALDEITDLLIVSNDNYNRSNIYRTFRSAQINRLPEEKKDEAKKFKEYKSGFLHIDVTYLPKLEGSKKYLFVAIDRATRLLFYKIYDNKNAFCSNEFFEECQGFFPVIISHILTDNGGEFINCEFKENCKENKIDLRNTKPNTPKTNGMVERVNGTIKNATIKSTKYDDYSELDIDINKFLLHYNFHRRHGSLKKELNVKTPFDALEKWYKLEPDLFTKTPEEFKNMAYEKIEGYILDLEQRCET